LREIIKARGTKKGSTRNQAYSALKQNFEILSSLIRPLIKQSRDLNNTISAIFKQIDQLSTKQVLTTIIDFFAKKIQEKGLEARSNIGSIGATVKEPYLPLLPTGQEGDT